MRSLVLMIAGLLLAACSQPKPEATLVLKESRKDLVEGKKESEKKEKERPCPTVHPCTPCPEVHTCAPCPRPKVCKPIIIYKEHKKAVLGEVEDSYLPVYKVGLKARIDTGAQTSSIHAKEIVPFERDGEKWVRFKIIDDKNNEVQIKKPIVKCIKVKRHGEQAQERYVVHMRLNIANLTQYIEVSLSDRAQYRYPVLIGRNFLQGNALVDVSKRYTKPPRMDIR